MNISNRSIMYSTMFHTTYKPIGGKQDKDVNTPLLHITLI